MPTRLQLIQRAQARIGDEPIGSEDDPGADTHIAIYDGVVEDLLSRYPWTFATVTRRLTRLTAVPPAHWAYYYQLPADMIGAPRAVYDRDDMRIPFTGYEITENRLASSAEKIWLRHTKNAHPGAWPGYFTELATTALMSALALSVREDSVLAARLDERAFGPSHMLGTGGLMGQARGLDAQAMPSPVVSEGHSPLVTARF